MTEQVVESQVDDWRTQRHATARARLLEAAWRLAERDGIGGLSLREVAREVGMSPPSVYSYFDGKHAIYDAMFAEGYEVFAALSWDLDEDDATTSMADALRRFLAFCQESPARYQLMFQRPIPDFEPSPAAYAHAQRAMAITREAYARAGVVDVDLVDLAVSLGAGLAAQQMSNDPGGDRWVQLVDRAAEMFTTYAERQEQS